MLRNNAYLVISSDAVGQADGVFELRHDLEIDSRVEKEYLVGNFGTAIQEAARYVDGSDDAGTLPERRQGYSVDAGGGTWGGTLTSTTGLEDVRWGDGSGGDGPNNVTRTDASGTGVGPLTRLHILQYWIANTLTDSRGQARLHIGEWTDGTYDDYRDNEHVSVSAGVFGRPVPVAIETVEPRSPQDEPSDISITIQYRRTQVADGVAGDVADWISALGDEAEDVLSGDSSDDVSDA